MSEEDKRKDEEEFVRDAERILKAANADPDIVSAPVPVERMREHIFCEIRAREAHREEKKEAMLSPQERELIRLGKIYQRRRKVQRYVVLAAALVAALAIGMTSIGGPEKIFGVFKRDALGREQTQVNSGGDVATDGELSEDEVYEQIEEKYGFYPVILDYLPEGTEFQEGTIGNEIQDINLVYGHEEKVDLIFIIRPNYRSASIGTDVEDTEMQSYRMTVHDVPMEVKQYRVEETGESRWSVTFSYQDVQYFLRLFRMEQKEVERVLNNLYFP